MSFGVMATPAIVIDDEVKSAEKLLKPKEIIKYLLISIQFYS